MVFYIWVELRCTSWKGQAWLGRRIIRTKGLEVSVICALKEIAECVMRTIIELDIPLGAGFQLNHWVTLEVPKDKEPLLFDYPARDKKLMNLVCWHDQPQSSPEGGANNG